MTKFFMMVGISGSGKTYYAHSLGKNYIVLSSDEIRKELYGSEEVQENPAAVFELMKVRTIAALKEGKNVVYDATNLVRKRRVALLQQLPANVLKTAVVVCTPITTCLKQNDARERQVPHEVIMNQLKVFEVPVEAEGFDHVITVMSGVEQRDFYENICNQMSHDSKYHTRGVGEHTKAMVKAAHADEPENDFLHKLCRYHDIGKALTKTVDESGAGHFYGHEHVSAYITLGITGDLRLAALVGEHMKLHNENFNVDKLKKYFTEEDIKYLRRLNYYDKTYD